MAQNRNWLRMQYHSRILTNRTQWYSLDLFEEGNLKLHFAARYGNEKDLDNFISAGADVNAIDGQGVTPLMYAVRWGQLGCIKALIREGADVNICNYIDYSTALTQVSYLGNMDCIEALVNTGADVNTVDVNGNSALIVAAGSGCSRRSQSIRLLLQAGAHVNKRNKLGLNALEQYLTQHASVSKQIALLLYASGEILDSDAIQTSVYGYVNIIRVVVPEFIRLSKLKLSLKHNCRQAIRKHLTDLDPHNQLFDRVPKLGLPVSLTRYVLYGMSLDEDYTVKNHKYDQVELQRRKFLP